MVASNYNIPFHAHSPSRNRLSSNLQKIHSFYPIFPNHKHTCIHPSRPHIVTESITQSYRMKCIQGIQNNHSDTSHSNYYMELLWNPKRIIHQSVGLMNTITHLKLNTQKKSWSLSKRNGKDHSARGTGKKREIGDGEHKLCS